MNIEREREGGGEASKRVASVFKATQMEMEREKKRKEKEKSRGERRFGGPSGGSRHESKKGANHTLTMVRR